MESVPEDINNLTQSFRDAVKNPDCPNAYTNGFTIVVSDGDASILFQRNGEPEIIMSMSYTITKTLGQKLIAVIADLEESTGQKIMTVDDVKKRHRCKEETS